MKLIIRSFLLIFLLVATSRQGNTQDVENLTSKWPAFTFKVNASANMYFGLRKSNHENINILRTPPGIGPELGIQTGIRINENASVYTGLSLSMVPLNFSYNFSGNNIYAPSDFTEWELKNYFIALSMYSIPFSFEYVFPIKNSKHHLLTEIGIVANYNSNYSYQYDVISYVDESPVFEFTMQDNKGKAWYPSGFLRLGYMKAFKKQGAFSASFRLGLTAAVLGVGSYQFHGFAHDFKGDVKLLPNALSFDFTYHFRQNRKKR